VCECLWRSPLLHAGDATKAREVIKMRMMYVRMKMRMTRRMRMRQQRDSERKDERRAFMSRRERDMMEKYSGEREGERREGAIEYSKSQKSPAGV
jgi:hypothetical protein